MQSFDRLGKHRRSTSTTFFDRQELHQLLNLYSQRVAAGEWRDYAIDHRDGRAIFSVFRHTLDSPAFSITKRQIKNGREGAYEVHDGRQRVKRSASLAEALTIFRRPLRVVS